MNITLTLSVDGFIHNLPASLIKSKRKSVGIAIKPGGQIIIRAPRFLSNSIIMSYVQEKALWILHTYEKQCKIQPTVLSTEEMHYIQALEKRYREAAKEYFPKRIEYYQQFTGGHYTKITIRDQKTRWGSCSNSGTLSFNYRLMLAPPRVLDYVVVHELCHLTHMNHSKDFWNMVESILPDYKEYKKWLNENGHTLQIQNTFHP